MKSVFYPPVVALAAIALWAPETAFACAVCGLDSEPGYLWSMGFLIGMPFAVAGAVGGVFAYNFRRLKKTTDT